ncbi:MAG: VWA domain-containing protein [Vicinamibacterales bacterium]
MAAAVGQAIGDAPVAAQAGALQGGSFKSGTSLVEVDAMILDRDGHFVANVRADDLELFEDGKRQTIQQFYLVSHARGSRSDLAAEATVGAVDTRRIFVLLFDEGSLATDSLLRVRQGAEAFVRDQLGPEDVGGVFVNGGMFHGRLTSDKNELLAGIATVRPAFDNRPGLLETFRAFPRIGSEVDAARIADGARELVDTLGTQACNEDPGECQVAGGLQQVENLIQQKSKFYVRQARMLTGQTLQNLQAVARGLSRLPGRKTVVFISDGFFVEDSRGALQLIAAQAARGGTTIYSIDGRGLVNTMSPNPDVVRRERARSTVFDTGEDGPAILTRETGGLRVHNLDDMSRAFGLVVRDTSTYYVIGYQPANLVMDGKFRRIQVKAKAGQLTVRARSGYVATTLPPQSPMWGK